MDNTGIVTKSNGMQQVYICIEEQRRDENTEIPLPWESFTYATLAVCGDSRRDEQWPIEPLLFA